MTYTDADVEYLVDIVQCFQRDCVPTYGYWHSHITKALKPFLPGPEEVLIDKMTEAYNTTFALWIGDSDARRRAAIAAALGVVRQEGLPT